MVDLAGGLAQPVYTINAVTGAPSGTADSPDSVTAVNTQARQPYTTALPEQAILANDANGDPAMIGVVSVSKGSANLATGQAATSVSPAAALQIVPARIGRGSVTITNITGTQPVYLVGTNVTTGVATGFFLAGVAGASVNIATSAAIFATSPTAAQTLGFMETF